MEARPGVLGFLVWPPLTHIISYHNYLFTCIPPYYHKLFKDYDCLVSLYSMVLCTQAVIHSLTIVLIILKKKRGEGRKENEKDGGEISRSLELKSATHYT